MDAAVLAEVTAPRRSVYAVGLLRRRPHDLQYRLSMVAPTTIRTRYRQVSALIKG
jgi:hypothetical protein